MVFTKVMNDHKVVSVTGPMTNEHIHDIICSIEEGYKSSVNLVVDLSEVTMISSAGISILLKYMNASKRDKKRLFLAGLRDDIKKLFVITGMNEYFVMVDSINEAVTRIESGS